MPSYQITAGSQDEETLVQPPCLYDEPHCPCFTVYDDECCGCGISPGRD